MTIVRGFARFLLAAAFAMPAAAQLKLGVSATLSGPNAVNGQSTVNGLNLALEQINAAGGPVTEAVRVTEQTIAVGPAASQVAR